MSPSYFYTNDIALSNILQTKEMFESLSKRPMSLSTLAEEDDELDAESLSDDEAPPRRKISVGQNFKPGILPKFFQKTYSEKLLPDSRSDDSITLGSPRHRAETNPILSPPPRPSTTVPGLPKSKSARNLKIVEVPGRPERPLLPPPIIAELRPQKVVMPGYCRSIEGVQALILPAMKRLGAIRYVFETW